MKKLLLTLLPFLVLLITLKFVLPMGKNVVQPIKFNHKKHLEDVGMSCTDCHQYVEENRVAGLPSIDVCVSCHEEALTESPEEAKLIAIANNNQELIWNRIYKMPEDVYFSHRRHVGFAGIECRICHGKIEKLTEPPGKVEVKLSMNFCMKCHNKMKADNDCIACHL